MKKFNRRVHRFMGELPPQLRKYIKHENVRDATREFNDLITMIAHDFHEALAADTPKENISLNAPSLFGMPVKLEYIASGSVGSVYKMHIGDQLFALKINRNSAFGELDVMPKQKRAPGLLNKMYAGAVFEHGGRKYSWVLSDYVANDKEDSFYRAMEKLYYAYLTKGIDITDAHINNFIDGKLIDQASFTTRTGKIDDIKQLTRAQVDIVKKLVYCIKTNDISRFEDLINRAATRNPAVVNYMFFAMKFGKSPALITGKMDSFAARLKKFESIVNDARRQTNSNNIIANKLKLQRGI